MEKSEVLSSLAKQGENQKLPITRQTTLAVVKGLIGKDEVKKRFEEIMGQKAGGFIASITSLVSSSTNFDGVDGNTVISSAIVAATLDLPINPNLGFAWIIPYWDNKKKIKVAQFQIGYKGFIQLAMRSSHYKTINVAEVYEGDILDENGLVRGNIYESPENKIYESGEIYRSGTNIVVTEMGTRAWRDTEQALLERGCQYSK